MFEEEKDSDVDHDRDDDGMFSQSMVAKRCDRRVVMFVVVVVVVLLVVQMMMAVMTLYEKVCRGSEEVTGRRW